jgi:hypothetical protein
MKRPVFDITILLLNLYLSLNLIMHNLSIWSTLLTVETDKHCVGFIMAVEIQLSKSLLLLPHISRGRL